MTKPKIEIPVLERAPGAEVQVTRQNVRWTNEAIEKSARKLVDYIWYNSSSLYVEAVYDELRRRLGYESN